jgi:hypothetical protein
MEEYLTIAEVAARLRVRPKTIKNKMAAGIFRRGIHYFSPGGIGPRFKWSAVVAWLEQGYQDSEPCAQSARVAHRYSQQKARGLDIGDEVTVKGQYVRR